MNFVDPASVQNRYNLTSTSKQFPEPRHSGRVPNFNEPGGAAMPSLYKSGPPIYTSDVREELVGHIHTETELNKTFFSKSNIEELHRKIQEQVSLMSGGKYKIDRQNDDDLKLIMRSYYLMFGRNNPNTFKSDLDDLNGRVIGYAAAKIFSEVDFYMFYRKDIEDFAPPIANPTNVKVYGTRYGELKSFF